MGLSGYAHHTAREWLIHYEIWLAIGEWYGGGENLDGGEERHREMVL